MKPKRTKWTASPSKSEALRVKESTVSFAGPEEWNAWLSSHGASSSGVMLKIAKRGGDVPSVTYAEAVDIALSWGWIDGKKQKHDERAWLQRFTPRGARSPWSKINRAKAEELMGAGKMHSAGLAEVERAKQDGRWEAAYDSARTSKLPDDLAAALAANMRASAFFASIDAANRYAILYRVQTAKKPETRATRITRFVTMLAKHETVHPPRKGGGRALKPTSPRGAFGGGPARS